MRKYLRLLVYISVIVMLSGCIKIPLGDGESLKLSKDGMTVSDSDGKETTVSMDSDDGTVSITDDEGSDISFGANAKIPESFPADIPIPKGAMVVSGTSMDNDSDGELSSIIYVIEDSNFDDIVSLYKNYLSKGNFESIMDSDSDEVLANATSIYNQNGNKMEVMQGSKEGETYRFNITTSEDENEITVNIVLSREKNND